jgi:ABC-type lipoprotein export system ATPase subunit
LAHYGPLRRRAALNGRPPIAILADRHFERPAHPNDTEDMSVLRLDHVSKHYLTEGVPVPALDNVSLDFQAGEFVALVGRSGCGKSTLLNLAGAMDFPSSGKVIVDGVVTSELSDDRLTKLRREQVGFVFQSFQLLPTLSVVENVELPLLLAGISDARAAAIDQLRWVEMDGYSDRMPYQLSGGQAQRVAIARALIHSPRLLLADEPTGNLDTNTSETILGLLRKIATDQNTTILMATHSAEASAVADTIVRLRDGRVTELLQQNEIHLGAKPVP